MTLLDDVRRLERNRPILGGSPTRGTPRGHCYYCGEDRDDTPHHPECLWLVLPRVIRALESEDDPA